MTDTIGDESPQRFENRIRIMNEKINGEHYIGETSVKPFRYMLSLFKRSCEVIGTMTTMILYIMCTYSAPVNNNIIYYMHRCII